MSLSRFAKCSLAVMGLVVGVVVTAGPAQANVGIGSSFTVPIAVAVGQSGAPGSFTVTNTNTPPDAGPNTLTQIQLTLSCGLAGAAASLCSQPELGVFTVTAATGAAGTACAGTNFTRSAPDATGAVTLTAAPAVVLAGPGVNAPSISPSA